MDHFVPVPIPYALVAEVTHRCPLHCVYCSNPLQLKHATAELNTAEWLLALDQAHTLGVVQLHLSGGEPLLRPDLEELVERGRKLEFYSNLITSGIGLCPERARRMAERGLDSVQLSVQAAEAGASDRIGGYKAFAEKERAAQAILDAGLPLSMNVVLHRLNLDQVEEIVDLCAAWGTERLELANTQYYGWGLVNRDHLLPTREQVAAGREVYERKKAELQGKMELIWVLPDYYESFPKPCMGGWGQMHLTVSPDGTVLPCQAAGSIKSLTFDSVREHDLAWIWRESEAFNAFRGFDWMQEPCRSCDRRSKDFGGCRCQALALTGDAARTDPVCQWAPDHHLVAEAVRRAQSNDAVGSNAVASAAHLRQLTYRHDPERT
jgi:PqqA peptide cyclase